MVEGNRTIQGPNNALENTRTTGNEGRSKGDEAEGLTLALPINKAVGLKDC